MFDRFWVRVSHTTRPTEQDCKYVNIFYLSIFKICCIVPRVRSIGTFFLIAKSAVAKLILKFYWPVVVNLSRLICLPNFIYSFDHSFKLDLWNVLSFCNWFMKYSSIDIWLKLEFYLSFLIISSVTWSEIEALSRQNASISPAACVTTL